MELEIVFDELNVLGSPLFNCTDLYEVVIIFPEADVPLGV
jgi:hypothetical protein